MKRTRVGVTALVVIVASLAITGTALAHALLVRSVPPANATLVQPPTQLDLWFSEPLEAGFSSVRLLTTSGAEVPLGKESVDPIDPTHLTVSLDPLSPGIYTVSWATLSRADGHEWVGSYAFVVLNPDGSRPSGTAAALDLETKNELPTSAQTVVRWLALMGGILFMSVPVFLKYVTAGLAINGDVDGLKTRFNALGLRLLGLGALAIFFGSWLQFALQAAQLDNLNLLLRLIYGTHTGSLALSRQTLALAGLLAAFLLLPSPAWPMGRRWILIAGAILEVILLILTALSGLQGEAILAGCTILVVAVAGGLAWYEQRSSTGREPWTLVLALGLAILLLFSLGSHAGAAVRGSFWAVLSDFVHLLATSAWVGGLMLLPLMLDQIRQASPLLDKSVLGLLFRRYGNMAKFSFFLLITTGLFNSLVQFPNLISLTNTVYGRLLLIKLVLVFLVWWMSLRSSNALRRPSDPSAGMAASLGRFSQQITWAASIGLLLMAAVAALVQTQPPLNVASTHHTAHVPSYARLQSDGLKMNLQVTPNQVGFNQFKVYLSSVDGSPVGDVQLLRLLFNYQDAEIGESKVDLNPLGTDVFGIDGAYLNQPGSWKISVYVRRRGMDDVLVGQMFKVPEPGNAAGSSNPFQSPTANTPADELLAGGMIALAFELYRWRRTLEQTRPRLYSTLMGMALVLFFAGVMLLSYAAGQSGVIFLPGT